MKLYLDDIDDYVCCRKSFWLKKKVPVQTIEKRRINFAFYTAIAVIVVGEFLCTLL